MWPKLVDMSRDESKRALRRTELEAYSNMVSAFRAQGDLNKEKKKILQDLQHMLSISTERHRAEVRRAVNDERLASIADNMAGSNVSAEWLIEGRRLIPLMPRLVPQTAFTLAANAAATLQAEKNATMPSPSHTGLKDLISNVSAPASSSSTTAPVTKFTRASSPTSNVVVLPSGMSIHIKGGLNTEEEEEVTGNRKRKRSSSIEGPITVTRSTMGAAASQKSANTIQGISPMKITLTKSPARNQLGSGPSQKVILVSNSGQSSGPSILQRSLSVPVMKSQSSTTSTSGTKTSIIVPSSAASNLTTLIASSSGNMGNVATATSSIYTSSLSTSKPHVKTITARPRTPQAIRSVQVNAPNVQIRPVTKQAIQIKQEGGMKIITTQSLSGVAGKILPKPPSGASVVVVTSGSTAVVTRAINTVSGKVVNITTSSGKVITTATRNTPNVVTVNPKTLQLTAVRTSGGITVSAPTKVTTSSGAKANVIVVQKAQAKKSMVTPPSTPPIQAKPATHTSPFEKELVSFIQKQDQNKQQAASTRLFEKKIGQPTISLMETSKVKAEDTPQAPGRSSLLAELIQAVGIGPESSPGSVSGRESPVSCASQEEQNSIIQQKVAMPINEWVECDEAPASAIEALLEMQQATSGTQQKPAASLPLQQTDLYALEEAAQLLSQQTESDVKTNDSSEESFILIQSISSNLEKQLSQHSQEQANPEHIQGTSYCASEETYTDINTQPSDVTNKAIAVEIPENIASQGQARLEKDIFSSGLTEAQIEQDPYQFVDDDVQEYQQPKLTHVIHMPHNSAKSATTTAGTNLGLFDDGQTGTSKSLTKTLSAVIKSGSQHNKSTFIPIQDVIKTSSSGSINIIHQGSDNISVIQQQQKPAAVIPSVSVTVEPAAGTLDASHMKMEDFTSQRFQEPASEFTESLSTVEGCSEFLSDSQAQNLGKRKRKPPPAPDDNPAPSVIGGWSRAALGLLQRVSRFRGANREKGEINAAAWFTRPVDPNEAPGYYEVITNPMDFSNIKKKLETTQYAELDSFHTDMLLVRDNCYKYNPPGSDVRLDCDEVFTFFLQEYAKMVERLQKPIGPSPPAKKAKQDKSPGTIRLTPS